MNWTLCGLCVRLPSLGAWQPVTVRPTFLSPVVKAPVLSQTDGAGLAALQLIYHMTCVCRPSPEDLCLARSRRWVNTCRVAVLRSNTAIPEARAATHLSPPRWKTAPPPGNCDCPAPAPSHQRPGRAHVCQAELSRAQCGGEAVLPRGRSDTGEVCSTPFSNLRRGVRDHLPRCSRAEPFPLNLGGLLAPALQNCWLKGMARSPLASRVVAACPGRGVR